MSGFLDFISNIVPITGDSLVDSILFGVIGLIAFGVAWYITGLIAVLIGYDPNGMSLVHWIIRIAIWLGLLWLISAVVSLVRWLFSFEWWVYIIIGCSLLLITGGIATLCIILKKKKTAKTEIK